MKSKKSVSHIGVMDSVTSDGGIQTNADDHKSSVFIIGKGDFGLNVPNKKKKD